jgi:hypothetical protein
MRAHERKRLSVPKRSQTDSRSAQARMDNQPTNRGAERRADSSVPQSRFRSKRATLPFVSYPATIVNVMIASPSDVPQERRIARDVIAEWNTIHARDRRTVLMPIGWETHSVRDTGDRPQAIINGQLLKDADLLVVMFWTRIGSPTGGCPERDR